MRCRQQNKMQLRKTFREVVLYLLHTMTGKHLLQTGLNDSYDSKWGCFNPNQSFNVDQTPMLFVIKTKHTYENINKKHHEKFWISEPRSGPVKR